MRRPADSARGARTYTAEAESRFIASVLERNMSSARGLATWMPSSVGPGTREWASYYASRSEEHERATRSAAWLEGNSDDRAHVFEQLVRPGSR